MSRTRRDALRLGGAALVGLAGCGGVRLSRPSRTDAGTPTTTRTVEGTPSAKAADVRTGAEITRMVPLHPMEPESRAPFATVAVGTREGVEDPENNRPHQCWVWNDATEAREIRIAVRRGFGVGTTVFRQRYEFPPDGLWAAELREPGAYALVVTVGDREPAGPIRVERSRFDCNASSTNVTVTPDGGVEHSTVTQSQDCGADG